MDVPETWQALCRFLGVPDRLSRAVWLGLRRAKWSTAVELRQAFLLHEPRPVAGGGVAAVGLPFAVTGLTRHTASPAKVILALEACVLEGMLSRPEANQFEEYVLVGMTASMDTGAAAAFDEGWLVGPVPDGSRWLTRGERETRSARVFHSP